MTNVTDIRRARDARQSRLTDHRDPDLVLEVWTDGEGEVIASCLKGKASVPTETGPEKLAAAPLALMAAKSGAVILSEMEEGEGAWMAEPVFVAQLLRGGFLVTQPNRFWHDEAASPLRKRVGCALWASRSALSMAWMVVHNAVLLVARPGRHRDLEVE
jgi:hypothetical protein